MSRSGFTPRQRLVLALMATAVVAVFGLLGYTVAATLRHPPVPPPAAPPLSPSATPPQPTETPPPSPTPSPLPPTPTRPVPLSQIQSARAVREVGRILAGVRELPPVEQMPVTFPTEHEVAIFLLRAYQEKRPQEALPHYAALGLIPPLDPLPLPDVAAQAAQVSALYLPAGQQIMLVAGRGPASPEDELGLAHALAHAFQDQAFDVEGLSPCRPTTDAALALRALVEGDAVLTTAAYAGVASDPGEVERLGRMAAGAEEPTYAALVGEAAYERLRAFPYADGARLIAALYAGGGWQAVNQAYARLPCSTEQVLHPEKYVGREPVQEIALPDLGPVLGEGWVQVKRDTLGELLIGLHLAAYLEDEGLAWGAADGWAGDIFALWQSEAGEQLLVWRTAWDNREEAEVFERSYGLLVPRFRTPPLISVEPPFDLPGRFWEGPAGAAYVVRAGRVVSVVWGPNRERVTAVAMALP